MKKTMIALAMVGLCNGVSAKSEVCNYSTEFNVNIDASQVVFDKKNSDKLVFAGNKLEINGKAADLTEQQLAASLSFQKNTRLLVPKVAKIAVEGAELGVKTATLVMTSLFGDDPAMQAELIAPIEALTEKIKANITENTFNTEAIEQSIENAFDTELEKMLELAMTKYAGKIVGNIFASIFSADSQEVKDLEFRMENLEQEINTYVEANAKDLELRANALCDDLVVLESLDKVLEGVAGYPKHGVVVDNDTERKSSGMTIDF